MLVVVIPSQASSYASYMAPRTQHLLYGPYSSQTGLVREMQSCFRLWTGQASRPSSQVFFSSLA